MKLPRHANAYLLFIGLLSLFQITIGANLIVLAAIDLVALSALYPMTRKNFGPNDLMFLSFCFYYGTFALCLKCAVVQTVQENLQVPMLTSGYLTIGFGLIFAGYLFVERVMTKHYRGTTLRKWNWFERAYADERFLMRFTLPLSIVANIFVVVVSLLSHSAQDVANGLTTSGGLATIGSLNPIIQLAFAMQMALIQKRGNRVDRAMMIVTILIAVSISILNNQKVLTFMIAITYGVSVLAFRVRIRPRFLVFGLLSAVVALLYVAPLIHIVRGMELEKTERFSATLSILSEANYNPLELQRIEAQMSDSGGPNTAALIDYLAPYDLGTDRFTLMMPIDQIVRSSGRAPLGFDAFLSELRDETLPKYFVGEHRLEALSDQVAWAFSLRGNGIISRPTLGLFGTGYGVAGAWGLLVLGPLAALYIFVLIKLTCNGSIWENPWAVFIASSQFFDGETDITIVGILLRALLPLLVIAAMIIATDRLFNKGIQQASHA